jgi:hypothetical protein
MFQNDNLIWSDIVNLTEAHLINTPSVDRSALVVFHLTM